LVVPVAAGLLALQVFGSYRLIANTFKWLTLALFAYVIDAFVVHPDLAETLRATVVPTLSLDPAYITTLVAILGTTISPYLFFWQSSEEVEEEIEQGKTTIQARRGAAPAEIRYATIDTVVGMGFSQVIMYFIILATALTLFKAGEKNITSAAEAAEALKPLAGDFAGILFAIGMIGAGLLAVPILSGSAAYAIAEAFGWRHGLDHDWRRATEFYAVIAIATVLGVVMNFIGINPIDALFWTAVINGAIAPPLLVLVMLAARNPAVMGEQRIGPVLTALGWIATAGMWVALIALVVTNVVK
jgi:Mn2+/Fe2+ NRAMP family transporter